MRFFITASFLLISSVCFAQRQNVYFLKNDDSPVDNKDSADFIRVVSEPDSASVLYNVVEYYPNGKTRRIGKSKTIYPIVWDGTCLTFYLNGRRKLTENYEDGRLTGGSDEYYSNGRLFVHKEHIIKEVLDPKYDFKHKVSSFTLIEAYDSLGILKVKDGKGIYSGHGEENVANLKVTEEGHIEHGLRSGTWKGFDKEYNTAFEEIYDNGELISGQAVCNGKSTAYSKSRIKLPEFPGGDHGFNMFLSRAIRYPAKDRENNTQGKVVLSFVVNKDGTITDTKVIRSVSEGIDNEALKVLKNTPNWLPGTVYGSPAKIRYSLPIAFALSRE